VPAPLTAQVTAGVGLPVMVRRAAAIPPAGTLSAVGETERCGACALSLRTSAVIGPEVAEPGFGFVTVICTFPAWEVVAVPMAVSVVAETKFVVRAELPKLIVAPFTNDEPETVIENEPALSWGGEMEESCGTGLSKLAVTAAVREVFDVTVALIVTAEGAGTLEGAV